MLDTIIYIPTILAYAFITLLVVILGFIVIYASHKIYISVYDNLPVSDSHSSALCSTDRQHRGLHERHQQPRLSAAVTFPKNASSFRKSKTALRVIVTLEPCYLAYVVFEANRPKTALSRIKTKTTVLPAAASFASSTATSTTGAQAAATGASENSLKHTILRKYFDRLTDIPRGRRMLPCPR